MLTIPNLISVIRIILVPTFCVLYFTPGATWWACAVLVLSGVSDVADGYIARKYNQVSDFGKVLDPIADKLFHISTIGCIVIKGFVSPWLLAIVVAKELFMMIGGLVFFNKTHSVIASKWYGKLASSLFFSSFVMAFILDFAGVASNTIFIIVTVIMSIAVAVSLFAVVNYSMAAIRINKEKKSEKKTTQTV